MSTARVGTRARVPWVCAFFSFFFLYGEGREKRGEG